MTDIDEPGGTMEQAEPQATTRTPEEVAAAQRQFNRGCGLTMLGVIVAVGLVSALRSAGDDEPSAAEIGASAEQVCQEWVSAQLKAPTTAEFADVYSVNASADFTENDVYEGRTGKDVWTVKGAVDAENSFGAMIRSRFTCEARLSAETWTLLDLSID